MRWANAQAMSLLLAHALKGLGIGFLVDKVTGFGIALYPAMILRVIGLRPFAYSADAMVITGWRILGHA